MTNPNAEAAGFLCQCGSDWACPAHTRCEGCGRIRTQYSIGEQAGFLAGRASRDGDIEAARTERDEMREERDVAVESVAKSVYRGNSVSYIYDKMVAYRDAVGRAHADIQSAVAAERERCATVALKHRCERQTPWDRACLAIAAAIRQEPK